MSIVSRTLEATETLERVDPAAGAVQRQVTRVLPDSRPVGKLLGGSWLGHPVHPVLVLLPIGAWLSATLLDLLGGQQAAARRLVLIGLLSAPPAAIAGAADFRQLGPRPRRVGFIHALANTVAVACFATSYWARRTGRTGTGRVSALLGLAAVGAGGTLGGHLSYAQGVGVYRWQPQRRPDGLSADGLSADGQRGA
jgi:uncharacterized membrane protein